MEKILFETGNSQTRQEELEKLENRSVMLLFASVASCIAACLLYNFGLNGLALNVFIILIACLGAMLFGTMLKFFTLEGETHSSLCITNQKVSGMPVLFDNRKPVVTSLSEITAIEKMDDSRLKIHTSQESYTFFTEETEEACRILNSVLAEARAAI